MSNQSVEITLVPISDEKCSLMNAVFMDYLQESLSDSLKINVKILK